MKKNTFNINVTARTKGAVRRDKLADGIAERKASFIREIASLLSNAGVEHSVDVL